MATDAEVFAGGVAVVTGAGSGIGAGFARRAGALGMTVVAADINEAAAQATVADITAAGGKAEALRVDVSRPDELDGLAETVFDRHGGCRMLINNAGIETVGFTWEIPPERWEATLNINLHGVIHGVRAFVPRMLASGQPAWIGNLASVGGFSVMPAQTAYIVTKHAVEAFSECLYLEMQVKGHPITVSSIIPGTVRTAIFDPANNAGEPADAQGHRQRMQHMLQEYGMSPDDAATSFIAQMAEGRFWCSSHPDMTQAMLDARIAFFRSQQPPVLAEQARALLDD